MRVVAAEPGVGHRWRSSSTSTMLNLQGFAHGGVLATLADAAMGLSVRSALEPGRRHVTVELSVHYLRPVTRGTVHAARPAPCGSAARSPTHEAVVTDDRGAGLSPGRAAPTA